MSLKIDISFPAGNVFIEDINGFDVRLAKDLRNSSEDWFYWAFRANFDAPGTYHFTFSGQNSIGARGPAVSYDGGFTWDWLGAESKRGGKHSEFEYTFDGSRGNPVIFCMGMQYQQAHLDAFLARHKGSPLLTVSELARTRKNRSVELLHLEDKSCAGPKKRIFLSSRHHCCEMMATYVLEGVLETFLADDETGRTMRSKFVIDAVPFVDKDGVIDGDQGKNRIPHDHNRDYEERPLYPEVAAIQQLILSDSWHFLMDMHCPWIHSGCNETIYFPGPEDKVQEARMLRFSKVLAEEAPPGAPHFPEDNILYGTGWNVAANYTAGKSIKTWAAETGRVWSVLTFEIAYANAREVTLYPDAMRNFGRAIARTIIRIDNMEE